MLSHCTADSRTENVYFDASSNLKKVAAETVKNSKLFVAKTWIEFIKYGPFKIFKNCCMFWGKVRILKVPTIDIKTQIYGNLPSNHVELGSFLSQIANQWESKFVLCINSWGISKFPTIQIKTQSAYINWRNTEAKNDAIIFLPVHHNHKHDLFDWLMDLNRSFSWSLCRNWELDYNFKKFDLAWIHYGQCCLLFWICSAGLVKSSSSSALLFSTGYLQLIKVTYLLDSDSHLVWPHF